MTRPPFGPAALALALFGLLACDGGTTQISSCELQAGPNAKNLPLSVEYEYSLTGSGEGNFTALSYRTNEGLHQADNPEEIVSGTSSEFIEAGNRIEIRARAEVPVGGARVGYTARDSVGTVVLEESDQCDVN